VAEWGSGEGEGGAGRKGAAGGGGGEKGGEGEEGGDHGCIVVVPRGVVDIAWKFFCFLEIVLVLEREGRRFTFVAEMRLVGECEYAPSLIFSVVFFQRKFGKQLLMDNTSTSFHNYKFF
jgi:hypothetical protein